ncbi:MAG: hypothetical protein NC200_04095 [Candidatus Gastranaerophilales bacterium]|nr:hypothetical protein [Candidatus Gastranaerophilales bacterium]
MNYSEAVNLLENGDILGCIDYFHNNNYKLEYAYALLLSGKLADAERMFRSIDSHRSDWAIKLIPLMQGRVETFPTYFQIRSFLEIDLNLLFKSQQIDYAQYILGGADIFQNINRESYKFLGRVLLKNGYMPSAKMFLDKALSDCYRDCELHYLFVEYYIAHNDFENAKRALENCLRVNPDYYPAKCMNKKLCNYV